MTSNGISKLRFDSIEDTIDAFRTGEFIVVLDSTDRENEGDLIIAAEDITTEKMAFMIRHTRYQFPACVMCSNSQLGLILIQRLCLCSYTALEMLRTIATTNGP